MVNYEVAIRFYEEKYDHLVTWFSKPVQKRMLGSKQNRRCRFCGGIPPEVTFKKVAHAIPEALGNKTLESAYECDACNEGFGRGIENDLGNWSKPTRTFARIRGKNGVPTLKRGGDGPGWRIEFNASTFSIKSYEDDPVFTLDEPNKQMTFTLKRDAYTPVAVLKAFMKIGLTLLPDDEVQNFDHLMKWVRDTDHTHVFANQLPVLYTFQPGPMPNDRLTALVLRRKPNVADVPYAQLILGYGNEIFQVQLPSEKYDASLNGVKLEFHPFPPPGPLDPALFGVAKRSQIDFTGRTIVRGETVSLTVGFESISRPASPS